MNRFDFVNLAVETNIADIKHMILTAINNSKVGLSKELLINSKVDSKDFNKYLPLIILDYQRKIIDLNILDIKIDQNILSKLLIINGFDVISANETDFYNELDTNEVKLALDLFGNVLEELSNSSFMIQKIVNSAVKLTSVTVESKISDCCIDKNIVINNYLNGFLKYLNVEKDLNSSLTQNNLYAQSELSIAYNSLRKLLLPQLEAYYFQYHDLTRVIQLLSDDNFINVFVLSNQKVIMTTRLQKK